MSNLCVLNKHVSKLKELLDKPMSNDVWLSQVAIEWYDIVLLWETVKDDYFMFIKRDKRK